VLLQDGENLVEELLLMEIVELQDGVHLVDDQVLMDKSRELVHNCRDEALVVLHANVDVIAGDHLLLVVHAHVELGSNTTDPDASHGVTGVGVVGHVTITSWLSIFFNFGGLDGSESR